MFGNCINFFDKIADDFIVGLATSFSDRSLTEQLKRNISYQIEHIQNPLVKMYVENNIENWITTVESYAAPLVKSLQELGFTCMASTSERIVKEEGPGYKKEVSFRFARFREYL